MLFNKSAVKTKRKPLKPYRFYRRCPIFSINNETFKSIETCFSIKPKDSRVQKARKITTVLGVSIKPDEHTRKGSFEGIRLPAFTLRDRKGHCIEQALLLNAILSKYHIPTKWVVMKNPKGYAADLKNWGIHAFNYFKGDSGEIFLADTITNKVRPKKHQKFIVEQKMNYREFCSFCFQDSGEDYAFNHNNLKKAITEFQVSLCADPNNYSACISLGEAFSIHHHPKKAEQWYREALKIAPNFLDVHAAYGDFLWEWNKKDKAKQVYLAAAEMQTKDFQILHSLEKRLKQFSGCKSIAERVGNTKKHLMKKKGFKGY